MWKLTDILVFDISMRKEYFMKCIKATIIFLSMVLALTSCSSPATDNISSSETIVHSEEMAKGNKSENIIQQATATPEITTTATTSTTCTTVTTTTATVAETTSTTETQTSFEITSETSSFTETSTSEATETTTETITQTTTETTTTESTTTTTTLPNITVKNLNVSTISVSCLKVTWDEEPDREYDVFVDTDADYAENMHLVYKEKTRLYITGLREDSYYDITVIPIAKSWEVSVPSTIEGHTEKVEVVYDFNEDEEAYAQYEYGNNTDFFAGESSLGLTADPSRSAIDGAVNDPITDTGICRDEYGDYCCAMGTYFGYCWDRFLVTFQNGQQITVKICDSKGDRWFHEFGGYENNHNIIEFIWYGAAPPDGVAFTGTWSSFIWNGLDFTHIESIQKINYPDNPIEY